MPISFFVYLLGAFGVAVSLVTANHTLDPFDYIYSDWVDHILLAYFGTTLALVCWWGLMQRVGAAVACYVLQPIIGIVIRGMMTTHAVYDPPVPVSESVSDMLFVMILMAVIFLIVFGLGILLRFIAEVIMALGRHHSNT